MSGPLGSHELMYATGSEFYEHQISNSMVFAGVQDLDRSRSSAGSQTTATISFWFKRAKLGAYQYLLDAYTDGNNAVRVTILSDDTIEFRGETSGAVKFELETTRVFRDPAAWYHFVGVIDMTNAPQSNRAQLYINGERQTVLDTATYPADNSQTMHLCAANTIRYGDNSTNDYLYYGYLAEIVVIDGTAQSVGDFGETKNGGWIPKDPSGLTFGTTGHYLKFANSGSLGTDSSGNSNNFTPYESVAAHDQKKDSPTHGGSSSGNFCVLNPINNVNSATLSEGNTKGTGGGAWVAAYGTFEVPLTGSWYWECISENHVYGYPGVQTTTTQANQQNHDFVAVQTGEYRYEGTGEANTSSIGTGDIIGFHVNNGVIKVYVNNSLDHTFGTNMSAGAHASGSTMPYYPSVIGSSAMVFNFGQDSSFCGAKTAQGNADSNGFGDFYYSPKGLALCSGNIPLGAAIDPAETDDDYSQKAFDALTYVGNGQSRTISTDFKSDLLWIKDMDASRRHYLVTNTINANFGSTSYLHPSNAVSEGSSNDGVTASSASNFTISGSLNYVNNNTNNYVAYQWRLNGGTTTALNDGDINATGQINQTHGHGILLYTGDGGSSAVTMAHGMGAKPEFLWMKDRDSNGNNNQWGCWHHHMASDHYLYFSQNAAQAASSNGTVDDNNVTSTLLAWNRTSTTGGSQTRFENGDNFIIYQFVSVYGHSKFGHYEGNGNANGTFVYTGFSPALVMLKSIDSTSDWEMYDNVRAGYNVDNNQLEVNDEAAQDTGTFIDLLSNGFKLRASGDPNVAETYIYGAWAHNSLKYATAV